MKRILIAVVLIWSQLFVIANADEGNAAHTDYAPNEIIEPQYSEEEKEAINNQAEDSSYALQSAGTGVLQKIERLKNLYPEGSYFTANGTACVDGLHTYCDNCSLQNILRARHTDLVGKIPGEAYSCCAFARFAFYYIFGHGTDANGLNMSYVGNSLSQALPGDYIIFYDNNNTNARVHYGIYLEGNKVLDSNATGKACQIKYGNDWAARTYTKKIEVYRSNNYVAVNSENQGIFDDVHSGDWYYDDVLFVKDKGIMSGLNSFTFGASQSISRAHVAIIVHRLAGTPATAFNPVFPDVTSADNFAAAVSWAYNQKIITGRVDTGRFDPADAITREEFVSILFRYAKLANYDVSKRADINSYPDANRVSAFSKDAISWAIASGIIKGDQGNISPQGSASRAQCATIIRRFIETK